MSNKDTGGPAFPRAGDFNPQTGMTLRDYFAAKAMQGLLVEGVGSLTDEELASWAFNLADAMLEARNK